MVLMRHQTCHQPACLVISLTSLACLLSAADDSSPSGDPWDAGDCLVQADRDELEVAMYLLQVQQDLRKEQHHPRLASEQRQFDNRHGSKNDTSFGSFHAKQSQGEMYIDWFHSRSGVPSDTWMEAVVHAYSHQTKQPALHTAFWFPSMAVVLLVAILALLVILFYFAPDEHRSQWRDKVILADLPWNRRLSYFFFAMALGISLATLQFMGPVQYSVFMDVVGPQQEPVAGAMVFVVLLPMIIFYGIGVTKLPSARVLVLTVCGVFVIPFCVVAVMLAAAEGKPPAWVAWLLYFTAETRSVIFMPMIWSVVADVSTPELSRKAYPFIFFVVQFCGMAGSSVAISVNRLGGPVGLLVIQSVALMMVAAFTWAGCSMLEASPEDVQEVSSNIERHLSAADNGLKSSASLSDTILSCIWEGVEGIWLLISRPYVFMVFFVSDANLMTRTVMNYQNMIMVKSAYPNPNDQVAYFGTMTMIQNVWIALVTLLGTRRLIERFDIGKVLLVLPIFSTICIACLSAHHHLMTATVACIVASTVAYSLNSPCKEILFAHTSRSIKYKAKSWSDMYGNNLMKLLGSLVNLALNRETYACKPNCFQAGPTVIIAGVWFVLWITVVLRLDQEVRELEVNGKKVT